MKTALICGGHGFIGHHMARRLKKEGYWVRTVDIKEFPYGDLESDVDDYVIGDLRDWNICKKVFYVSDGKGFDEVYQFSAVMGGAGYIFTGLNDAKVMHDSALLNINIAEMSRKAGVKKLFFSSSACFLPGIYVITNYGGSKIENIEIGDYVLTHTGNFNKVLEVSDRKYKGIIKIIRIPGFPPIQCTEEHPFLLETGEWIKAKDLNNNDRLIMPIPKLREDNSFINIEMAEKTKQYLQVINDKPENLMEYSKKYNIKYHNIYNWLRSDKFNRLIDPLTVEKIELDSDFGELIGFYLANGWVEKCRSNPRLLFSFRDTPEYKKRISLLLNKCFGIPYNRICTINMKNQKGFKLEVVSKTLYEFFSENFYDGLGTRAVNKLIPIYLMNSNKDFLRGLIKGYWLGDGNVYTTQSRTRISNSTVSLNLNCCIRMILNYLGIPVSLVIKSPESHNFQGRVIKGNYDVYQSYIVGKEAKDVFSDILNIEDIETITSKYIKVSENNFSLPIISIEDGFYDGSVYNMEVEGDNSYTVYGIAVHNCVYNQLNQKDTDNPITSEDSAYPAYPDSDYGFEKLISERLYLAYARNYCLNVKIARFHNIMGPEGAWGNGKEKSPAAICRKIAEVADGETIEIWGDGCQTRSYLYIDECLEGVRRLMNSDFSGPVNIGSDEMVSINKLVEIVKEIAGKPDIKIRHISGPLGVRGRNSDNKLIKEKLGWVPNYSLVEALKKLYPWIKEQVESGKEDCPWSN